MSLYFPLSVYDFYLLDRLVGASYRQQSASHVLLPLVKPANERNLVGILLSPNTRRSDGH